MYIGLHNHTDHSNYRLLDSINKIDELINYSRELGHLGMAITEHETVGSHVNALHLINKLKSEDPEKWKDYKLILGNEIYLCSRKKIQEEKEYIFPHFILLAKNARGHKAIRELSTIAYCENSFMWVNLRVPTFYDDLFKVLEKYKGDIIGSTACAGGTLPRLILSAYQDNPSNPDYSLADKWIKQMSEAFGGGNFFLELQPSIQPEQIIINQVLVELAAKYNINYIITTDAHYLKKGDRKIHEAFLNSQDGDREVGDFYATTYVMSEEELHSYLDESLGSEAVQKGIDNTMLIYNMCEEYTLDKPLNIPYIPFNIEEPNEGLFLKYKNNIPLLDCFYHSQYDSDRHLIREILNAIDNNPEDYCTQDAFEAIQTCLESIQLASDKQNTRWSAYLMQTKDIVQTCWESGSLVGCSRGSGAGFALLAMLQITQINPLKEEVETFHWRFLNPERVSPLDIDIDIQGTKRDDIIYNLRKQYGGYRHVAKVQTLSTAASKKALQIACRGLGYPAEDGIYLGSFIKAERGLLFTLSQTYYGDESNNITPDAQFVSLMDGEYSDVWQVAQKIEGLIVGTGQHAGGCIITKEDMVNDIALMKTKSGDITTQFDLHDSEACSLIKWDILAIDALEKMHTELDLLLEDGYIEWQGSLKDTYEKYLGVYNIERNNPEIWDMIDNHKILSLFQWEKSSGYQALELGHPRCLEDMAALNSIMRLMPPDSSSETPLQRYSNYKKDISLWYKEMEGYGLNKDEQQFLEKYALKNAGTLANQEDFMLVVQDPKVGGFNLLWADRLRKSIAKKNPKEFLELEREFYDNMKAKQLSYNLCHYTWDVLISMNKGYGFNKSHTLGYSIIALQEANLAYHYPVVYWNTACLIADSGGQDSNVRYEKIAAAVGRMIKEGIDIVPPYINEARFGFKPDVEHNRIIYGLKAVNGIGTDVANAIEKYQPYNSVSDFYNKMQDYKTSSEEAKFGDSAMIALIKAGAFDTLESKPRHEVMQDFIKSICNPISKINANQVESLAALGMLTDSEKQTELRYIRYKKYIYQEQNLMEKTGKSPSTYFYKLDSKFALPYFYDNFENEMEEGVDYKYIDGEVCVKRGKLDKLIDGKLNEFMYKLNEDPKYLEALNRARYQETWDDKVKNNNISRWEMDSMNFYFHEHELAHVDKKHYNLKNFDDMPAEPVIAKINTFHGREVPRYALDKIIGTVIGKDASHNTITLLTLDGVVTIKFYKGQFGFYARELAEKDHNTGKKTIIEKSWFKRGTQLLVTGVRIGENFIAKNYKDSIYKHSVQLIKGIAEDGTLILVSDRAGVNREEEDAIRI